MRCFKGSSRAAAPLPTSRLFAATGNAERALARLLHRFAHGDLEDGEQGVRSEGTHAIQRFAHFGPVRLRAAGAVEGLPDLLDEEVDEGAGHAVGMAPQLLGGGERAL